MSRKNAAKVLAESIIRSVVDDIRWPDVLMHVRDHEEAEEVMNLIEDAKVTVRWSR